MKQFCKNHYISASLLAAAAGGLLVGLGLTLLSLLSGAGAVSTPFSALLTLSGWLFVGVIFIALLLVYPFVLTGIELFLLCRKPDGALAMQERVFDAITLFLGVCYSLFYLIWGEEVVPDAPWSEALVNNQLHTPINPDHLPTLIALALVGLAGYLMLTYLPLQKLPPLVIVLSISALYPVCAVGILWGVQVCRDPFDVLLCLVPANVLLISARTIRGKMAQWNTLPRKAPSSDAALTRRLGKLLRCSACWPLMAFLLVWPLLGILLCLLALFGQSPSAAIRAFTQTSDWNLSQCQAPQNIYYDEHYLCTVAAGGHKKLVKPLRRGVRHGHGVIVNRQLCVANAFEQILEERTPRFHRALRHFYDTYGFPVAKLIHSPYVADLVYFVMKPLEWFFLLVLYCTDARPEDRIAIQYTGKSVEDFPETEQQRRPA